MQISCLMRGICDYEEIAGRCFYLIRKWKVIVFTPWLGGTGADGLQDAFILWEDSEVAEGQRSLKPRYSVHPFTKT